MKFFNNICNQNTCINKIDPNQNIKIGLFGLLE